MANKKLIIVAAINGGMQQDREGAKIPVTPEEIAEEAKRCRDAGAAVVHIHARDAEKRNSGDPKLYSEIITRIREKTDILIQTTNGIGVRYDKATGRLAWPADSERLGLLDIQPRQDVFGIAASSGDFYNPEGGYTVETPYVNSRELLEQTIKRVFEMGSAVEFECPLPAMYRLKRLADDGVFDANRKNLWILTGGGFGSSPPIARNILFNLEEARRLFPNALLGTTGTGKDQFWLCTLGIAVGCDTARVGFEDNIYLPSGRPAQRNDELVRALVEIAAVWGREPATPQEAREIFQITNPREMVTA